MARSSTSGGESPDITAINLARLIGRLQQNLLKSDAATEHRLRTSVYERSKVGTNIEYAKTLLLRLEQDAANIKVLSRKQEAQMELLRKRDAIDGLSERLKQLNDSAPDSDEDSSEGEDLLGADTPSDDDGPESLISQFPTQIQASPPGPTATAATLEPSTQHNSTFPSALRSRTNKSSGPAENSAQTTSSDMGSTALQEKMLSHNRAEQESLTESLLAMAQALRASTKGFSNTLEADKDIVDRAVAGLDQNTSGLAAAQKRMGLLGRMSEGKGWWGRMMLYAWIFGLMFLAFFIVAFMPKLRF